MKKLEIISTMELISKNLKKEREIHIKLSIFQTIIPKNWTKAWRI